MKLKDIPANEYVRRWPHVHLDQFDEIRDGSLENMQDTTLDMFDRMCAYAYDRCGWEHRINSGYRDGDKGKHGKGKAIDAVFFSETPGDVPVLEQWSMALRFDWGGIGFYPNWNTPGLHVDTRNAPYRAMWYARENGSYGQVAEYLNGLIRRPETMAVGL